MSGGKSCDIKYFTVTTIESSPTVLTVHINKIRHTISIDVCKKCLNYIGHYIYYLNKESAFAIMFFDTQLTLD